MKIKFIILTLSIIGVVLITGCTSTYSNAAIKATDFNIHDLTYGNDLSKGISYTSNLIEGGVFNKLVGAGTFVLTTERDDLFIRIFNTDPRMVGGLSKSGSQLKTGDNKLDGYFAIDTIDIEPELKFCVSTKTEFTELEDGVICKIIKYPKLIPSLEIVPAELHFSLSKKDYDQDLQGKSVTVKNTGNFPTYINANSPSPGTPDYESGPFFIVSSVSGFIGPGESTTFTIKPIVLPGISEGDYTTYAMFCVFDRGGKVGCTNPLYNIKAILKSTVQ